MFKNTYTLVMALFLTSNMMFADFTVNSYSGNEQVEMNNLENGKAEFESIDHLASESVVVIAQSCFSFYHELFHTYYGGITLDNVADFNFLVAQCQATFENQ